MTFGAPTTRFIGRVSEIELVGRLLQQTRLLTIMGTAGSGKTRLAYEASRLISKEFPGGVFYCELAPLLDAGRVPAAVAEAFNAGGDPGDQLAEVVAQQLGGNPALLVLDNCEHLQSAVASLASDLIAKVPSLTILATSRERLRVQGETAWTIPPLSLPDESDELAGSDAAVLLIERVRATDPQYAPSADAQRALAQICKRLDGLPLAIELAASRLALIPAAQLMGMLDDALTALAVGEGAMRQKTMSAALDWSHDLMSEADRATFRRLSVFAGAFDLSAASAVLETTSGGALDRLAALRDHSLLTADTRGDTATFRMLEPVRQYAAARLRGHADEVRVRRLYAQWVVASIEEISARVFGRDQLVAVRRFRELLPDFRRAFHWALTEEPAWATRMASASEFLWDMTGQLTEGHIILLSALEAGPTDRERARIYVGLSNLADRRGDPNLLHYAEAAVASARAPAAESERGYALFMLGFALRDLDPRRSTAVFDEAANIASRSGDRLLAAWVAAVRTLGMVFTGGVVEARRAHDEQIPVALEIGDIHSATIALANLARICTIQGDNSGARQALRAHLRLLSKHMNWAVGAPVLITASILAARAGRMNASAELAGAYWRLCRLFDRKPYPDEPELNIVRSKLTASEYEAAVTKGAGLKINEMFEMARHEAGATDPGEHGNLTVRELEVARLVARGLSNKQVAARLRRSERTVESHVQHALGKLRMSSRTELGAWAQRHGLLD